ncbi:MAG: GH42 [uncultured Chloroflexi bacterium]|uniref:beta-galactosidase n=1 Tax=uncultured Chloroflexota bacterium TaxID=166587 RepID=A0A6J4K756_9CHLR|nr:MAG: GH42 [uncultured Chloroflexota bacterium]
MTTEPAHQPSATSLPGLAPFPYGAVYFRKSNPPREDWERDYQTAAEDGMNTFRQWVLWSAIETAPGTFDWSDYDRQLELAAQHGAKVINAEMITAAPEWAWRQYAHARYEARDGTLAQSTLSGSCATGGFPGLCLDNDDARELAGRFLIELASHYRGHPGLGGYDVWNECNVSPNYCYCPATAGKFREWLAVRYGTPQEVGRAWRRYSYVDWDDVQPPRFLGPWPEVLDWLRFRIDQAYRWMRWRVEKLRAVDPDCHIVAHGVARSLDNMAAGACDEWRAAAEVEGWGYTWGSSRHGDEPWKQWHAVDLVRAGAWSPSFNSGEPGGSAGEGTPGTAGSEGTAVTNGTAALRKPFWHAEAYAGPLWMQSNVVGKPRDEGRIASPEDVRVWDMQSFAAGATGLLYLRWRPLLDGPLFGAFGAYGMDGSRTPRSEMAARIAHWVAAPDQAELWRSRPVQGDIGIVVVPESQLFCYAQQGNTDFYAQSARGAYRGFFENNVQADWVHIRDLDAYRVLYLPYPVSLAQTTATRLRSWVERGGTLISEGCPAYWDEHAHVGTAQPNLGLDQVFGARQEYVEFTPDLLNGLTFEWQGIEIPAGVFLQSFDASGGRIAGRYTGDVAGPSAGNVAAVEHTFGEGSTLLFGTFPGYGHFHTPTESSRHFFAMLLEWAGVRQHVRVLSTPEDRSGRWRGATARLHAPLPGQPDTGSYLWVTNPGHDAANLQLRLADRWKPAGAVRMLWGEDPPRVAGNTIEVVVRGRDAAVIRLA